MHGPLPSIVHNLARERFNGLRRRLSVSRPADRVRTVRASRDPQNGRRIPHLFTDTIQVFGPLLERQRQCWHFVGRRSTGCPIFERSGRRASHAIRRASASRSCRWLSRPGALFRAYVRRSSAQVLVGRRRSGHCCGSLFAYFAALFGCCLPPGYAAARRRGCSRRTGRPRCSRRRAARSSRSTCRRRRGSGARSAPRRSLAGRASRA